MTWLIPALLLIAFFLVFRRLAVFRRLSPAWGGIFAAGIVIASSAYWVATEPPESLSFRLHLALIIAMVVVLAF